MASTNTPKPFPAEELRALAEHFALVGKVLGNGRINHWTNWADLLNAAISAHAQSRVAYSSLMRCYEHLDTRKAFLAGVEHVTGPEGLSVLHDIEARQYATAMANELYDHPEQFRGEAAERAD